MTAPVFDDAFRLQLHALFAWRRDVRRFRTDPIPEGLLEDLLEQALLAPSVGLSQPWRFVIVDEPARRAAIIAYFSAANAEALRDYEGELARNYARLKLEGLEVAPTHLAVFCDRQTEIGHGLGRRTMPEMADYSAVAAVQLLWLAARAAGIGMGWVSILDPATVNRALEVPDHWRLIGYFCLGWPEKNQLTPELEEAGWARRIELAKVLTRR